MENEAYQKDIPSQPDEDGASASIIIARLMKKLDDILADSFEVALLAHRAIFLGTRKEIYI
jgi:hypothetical protein